MKNSIWKIKNDDREIIYGKNDIKKEAFRHFQSSLRVGGAPSSQKYMDFISLYPQMVDSENLLYILGV